MIRFSMIVLCMILLGAAAGRYKAEASVRAAEVELRELALRKEAQRREIQILRSELALLESPDRLAELADQHTSLEPLSGHQLMTADDFLVAFGQSGDDSAAVTDPLVKEDDAMPFRAPPPGALAAVPLDLN
ncbi:MAG: hypothetical protein EVA70_01215 [Parvularculaceae bacterium]|nr:MAG: hypothetical protein EVA70_01215 [Parvularculaceae bacterium]